MLSGMCSSAFDVHSDHITIFIQIRAAYGNLSIIYTLIIVYASYIHHTSPILQTFHKHVKNVQITVQTFVKTICVSQSIG